MNNNTKKRKPMEELQRKAQKLQTLERFSNLKVENRVVSGASMDDKFSERRFIKLENVTTEMMSSEAVELGLHPCRTCLREVRQSFRLRAGTQI